MIFHGFYLINEQIKLILMGSKRQPYQTQNNINYVLKGTRDI